MTNEVASASASSVNGDEMEVETDIDEFQDAAFDGTILGPDKVKFTQSEDDWLFSWWKNNLN